MFKVEFLVDDRKLAPALTALAGLVLDLKVMPVVNAVSKKQQIVQRTDGTVTELVREFIAENNLDGFKIGALKGFTQSIDRSQASAAYALQNLIKEKFITKRGKSTGTTYHVTKGK